MLLVECEDVKGAGRVRCALISVNCQTGPDLTLSARPITALLYSAYPAPASSPPTLTTGVPLDFTTDHWLHELVQHSNGGQLQSTARRVCVIHTTGDNFSQPLSGVWGYRVMSKLNLSSLYCFLGDPRRDMRPRGRVGGVVLESSCARA